MRGRHALLAILAAGVLSCHVSAQSIELTSFLFRRPKAPCDTCAPATSPLTVVPPSDLSKTPEQKDQPPAVDAQAFAQAPAAGGEGGMSFNPAMFGDLGAAACGQVTVRTVSTVTTTRTIIGSFGQPVTITTTSQVVNFSTMCVPILGAGSFKISDNESPRPTDRVFLTYNYFDRVTVGDGNVGLNREVLGFEKTFLDGDASFELRLPFLQATGGSSFTGFTDTQVADLTLISKFALINNRDNGNVLSTGLALTVPTADHSVVLADGSALHSLLFQPYGGWILNAGDFYAHAFHSIVVPTDSRDITEFNNDIAVGYWLFRGPGLLRGIVPTIEGHVYTPLSHRNDTDLVHASNIVTLTGGVNFVFPGNSTLGIAVATPVTGPRPDNVEALVSFNLRF